MRSLLHGLGALIPRAPVADATRGEDGQAMVEYSFIIVVVALAALGAVTAMGPALIAMFGGIVAAF